MAWAFVPVALEIVFGAKPLFSVHMCMYGMKNSSLLQVKTHKHKEHCSSIRGKWLAQDRKKHQTYITPGMERYPKRTANLMRAICTPTFLTLSHSWLLLNSGLLSVPGVTLGPWSICLCAHVYGMKNIAPGENALTQRKRCASIANDLCCLLGDSDGSAVMIPCLFSWSPSQSHDSHNGPAARSLLIRVFCGVTVSCLETFADSWYLSNLGIAPFWFASGRFQRWRVQVF